MPGVRDKINCSFTACKTGIRKCWQWVQCHKPIIFVIQDQYNVICLGLSGAGKTTILTNLTENQSQRINPTNGFYIKTLPIRNIILSIKEIGGVKRLQKYWSNYYDKKQAILFVLNASNSYEELNEVGELLKDVLNDYRLKNKPCLILGTHTDLPNSRTASELEQFFKNIMHGRKWTVYCCSSFDKIKIMNVFEILIDLMSSNT